MNKCFMRSAALLLSVMLLMPQSTSLYAAGNEQEAEASESRKADGSETFFISGDTFTLEDAYVNPIYGDMIDESDLKQGDSSAADSGISTFAASVYTDSIEEAAAVLREGMTLRQETIQVNYMMEEFDEDAFREDAREMAAEALIHTGVPDEGDYLAWSYGGWTSSASIRKSSEDGMYYADIDYTYTYYTTYEQEQEVNEKLAQVLDQLDVEEKSRYSKVSAVYDYICENVTYDYEHVDDSSYKIQYTAYGALIDQTAVCQGYAVLLYRMALELGIDCRVIAGTAGGENHGWNILLMDGVYFNADSTWDAGSETFSYFLKGEDNFEGHTRMDEYATEAFCAEYPMSGADYDPDTLPPEPAAPEITSVFSRDQNSAKVSWTSSEKVDGYQLYRAENQDAADDSWSLVKTISDGSAAEYRNNGLTTGKTYYYKLCSFREAANGEILYSPFSNISYQPAAVVFDGSYSNSSQRIRLCWNEVDGAHGYQIWRQNEDGSFQIVKTLGDRGETLTDDQGSTTAYSNTGLEAGTDYVYRMRAFAFVNGQKVYGAYSDHVTVTVLPESTDISLESPKAERVRISWEAVKNADGYQIWRSDSENGTFSIIKSIPDGDTLSYTNTGLRSGNRYYYKVRAYITTDSGLIFGGYSQTEGITVK